MHSKLTSGVADGSFQAGGFTIIRTEHAPELNLRRHDHESATIVVVRDGTFEERVGSRSFRCGPGSVLIKPSGAHHSNRYDQTGLIAILASVPERCRVPGVRHFRHLSAMQRLAYEFRCRDDASALVCEVVLLELLQDSSSRDADTRKPAPAWLRAVEERLRSEPLVGLQVLAAQVHRDPVHLAREFRRHYGCSPGEYARATRVERACEMLRRSDESIAAIALAAGFYDQSHFTNVFRRLVGTTPAEYRRNASSFAHASSKTASRALL